MIYVLPKELAGVFAMWAVRRLPHLVPENLAECITEFVAGFEYTQPVLEWKDPLEFMQAIKDSICKSPACLKLNERKNGREGMGFSSRYDQPEADDDFIDLDALTQNIFRTITATQDVSDNAAMTGPLRVQVHEPVKPKT